MFQGQQSNPTAAIVEFCRVAAEQGLPAGVKETLLSLQAVEAVGIADRAQVKFALRAILCSSKDDWDAFHNIFESFWDRRIALGSTPNAEKHSRAAPPNRPGTSLELIALATQPRPEDGEGK